MIKTKILNPFMVGPGSEVKLKDHLNDLAQSDDINS